ncbi:phosphoribosylamine--glycine ligase [Salisediminibacterium halotolerans]|uniref:phosphoribosylamine--glycine ligase n=1 Tax=Salisediminibacterium halotolerans TaxID=517425 RepID=UPI000EB5AA27|nr:phosphoribosylamine--glycine ligase [Salisediminibacterium halotolerans]RLJ71769.1 phosphoribosylamine--glycine ligase [Actinophytocola xinjiangensis]RPE86919.1 phosphoribosylamine--glycine ligase [Salisediminibacterium halotolerans]TWG32982.1 phosphoribosylamine--glycine ligase [Salisediminibacterium halotolerans]GEL08564.1 phosphoribosylamine--glycine ligase [Salisediminibacterium halotolerans]
MKVLLIGSGGREHALAWTMSKSAKVSEILVAPGSDAMSYVPGCRVIEIAESDHEALKELALAEKVDLIVPGPEGPLVEGITDVFQEAGLRVFGPTKAAAEIEGSKEFAKKIMDRYQIPTAAYQSFSSIAEAKAYVDTCGAPIVVKADGLAAGKGVVVAETNEEAYHALDDMMTAKAFGDAGRSVVIEECLRGEELSVMALVHGETVVPLVSAQDHKRACDGDTGPNTGGMGAYSPVPHLDASYTDEIMQKVLRPAARGMSKEGRPFTGVLYAGLMITEKGPKVIEFNARFGDPETQVVLPRLKSDLFLAMMRILAGEEIELDWTEESCAGVVVASSGYPGPYEKGWPFQLPSLVEPTAQQWFHAGTTKDDESTGGDGAWKTAGGRVLLLATVAPALDEAVKKTYQVLEAGEWEGMYYRKDIAGKVLN